MSFTAENIEVLEEIITEFLESFFSYFHSSSEFEERLIKSIDKMLNVYQTHCRVVEGSPESKSFSFSTEDIYSISHSEIKHFVNLYFNREENKSKINILEKIKAIGSTNYFLDNPHLSLFGFIVYRYLKEEFKADESEDMLHLLDRIEFNENSFKKMYTSIINFIVKDSIELEYYYFIYGIRFEGENIQFNEENREIFINFTNEIREEIIPKFRFKRDEFSGVYKMLEKMNWIMHCPAAIHGKIVLDKSQIKKKIESLNDMKITNINLIIPIYLEEAFFLLGYNKPLVQFVSVCSPNYYGYIGINPSPLGIFPERSSLPFFQYPDWMNREIYDFRSSFSTKEEFKLSEDKTLFLKLYPEFRSRLKENSIDRLILNRVYRLKELYDPKDIILESCIIFETLTTTETKEIGFQLRIKLAWLLAQSLEDKKLIQKITRILYDIRSDIVHNGGINSEKKAKKLGGLKQAATISKKMVRMLILRILDVKKNRIIMMSRGEISDKIDNSIVGHHEHLHESIYFKEKSTEFFEIVNNLF